LQPGQKVSLPSLTSSNQIFTVLFWGSDRSKFKKPPETPYSEKEICVTGMIRSYQGKAEIVVKDPGQIKVK
jgi:hypothetical protein